MDSQSNFSGHVALITGGNGAIGSALALSLQAQGARVIAADLQGSAGARSAGALGLPGQIFSLDVTKKSEIENLVRRIESEMGKISLLVNVAGVVSFGSAENLAEDEWDRVISINLKGTFLTCQAVMGSMKRAGFGRIVNIGSVVGKNGGNARPWLGTDEQARASNVAYGVSKAGVHIMTYFLAKELASSGVTVNAVAPGPVATTMTASFPPNLQSAIPVGRMGTTDDVVRAIVFLLSPDAGFITGEVLDVNGGLWCD